MKLKIVESSLVNFKDDALTSEQMSKTAGGSGCVCNKTIGFYINGTCVCLRNAFRFWGDAGDGTTIIVPPPRL